MVITSLGKFANLATFMENVERVDVLDDRRSHWVVKAPGGKTVEWTSVVTEEAPNSFIAWASEEGAAQTSPLGSSPARISRATC